MCNPYSITNESVIAARQCRFQDRNRHGPLAGSMLYETLSCYPHARNECDKDRRARTLHQPFPRTSHEGPPIGDIRH
jgi:hypothetical protein